MRMIVVRETPARLATSVTESPASVIHSLTFHIRNSLTSTSLIWDILLENLNHATTSQPINPSSALVSSRVVSGRWDRSGMQHFAATPRLRHTRQSSTSSYARIMDLGGHEAAALLTLLRTRERGTTWSSIATEVADHGSAVALLEAQHDGELFPSAQLEQAQADAQEQLRNWATAGYRWVTVLDDTYPAQLRDIREAPPFLFYAGHLQPDERGVSIVGSRNASAAALGFASEAARYLVGTG